MRLKKLKGWSDSMLVFIMMGVIVVVVILIIIFGKGDGQSTIGGLKVGDKAPEFSVQDYSGRKISDTDYEGKNILLYFNEGVGCAPCWQQTVALQKDQEKFDVLNTAIVTIGVDPAEYWKAIVDSNNITLPILLDIDKKMSMEYKVLDVQSSMHMGEKPGHTFVLVGVDRQIKWVGDFPEMNVTNDQILEQIKNI